MEKKIKILPGGPYELPQEIPVRIEAIGIDGAGTSVEWEAGREYENPHPGEPVHLCRCGHSSHKPFCDGTHKAVGFEGAEYASKAPFIDQAKRYEGAALDLLDNENLCASMRFCDRGPGVWDATIESGDPENRALAIEEACACAAGRLVAVDKQGNAIETNYAPEVGLVQDTAARRRGPLAVRGNVPLEGADGEPYEVRNRMTLCRCGESQNMPFCDISHMKCEHMKGFDE